MDWLPWGDGFHVLQFWHGLAQTPAPNFPSPTQVDLLRQQLDFLTKENARQSAEFTEKLRLVAAENQKLSESFKMFVSTMREGVYFVGILSGLVIGFLAFLFGRSFKEAQETAKAAVTRQVEERMAVIADNRINVVRRSLERESVIDRAKVEYWLLGAQVPPPEYDLLQTRGFNNVEFCTRPVQRRRQEVDVIVLDLNNWQDAQNRKFKELPKEEKEQQAEHQIGLIEERLDAKASMVIVVYVTGVIDYLNKVGQRRLIAPANNKVTLVGMVVDATYLVVGDR